MGVTDKVLHIYGRYAGFIESVGCVFSFGSSQEEGFAPGVLSGEGFQVEEVGEVIKLFSLEW